MKPIFWQFNGLLEDNLCKYTVVLTPHFLDRMVQRGTRIGGTHLRALVPKFWSAAITNEVCGTEILNAFVYFKQSFSKKRKRWELEFITVTPNRVFNTKKFKSAIRVELDKSD